MHPCCLCLAGLAAEGCGSLVKSQTKPQPGAGCGGSRVLVVPRLGERFVRLPSEPGDHQMV